MSRTDTQATDRPPAPLDHSRWATAAVAVAVGLPVLLMAVEVARAPMMPSLDYWTILSRALHPDGSLNARGLMTFQNGHPTFIPALAYYLNAAFLGGTNTVLGVVSLLLAGGTLLLLLRTLRAGGVGGPRLAAAAVLFSWLLFSPKGLHNFAYGFSGVAWLSANLFVVAAIVLAARGRPWHALVPALLACACYGSGFAVWPALLVVQWCRRAGRVVLATTLACALVVGVLWLAARPSVPSRGAGGGLPSYVQSYIAVMGGLWTSDSVDLAVVMGLVTIAVAAVVVRRTIAPRVDRVDVEVRRPTWSRRGGDLVPEPALPWVGLLVWGAGAFLLVASSRAETGVAVGLDSRYTSLPALTVCAIAGLVLVGPTRLRSQSVALPIALLAVLGTAGATGVHRQIHDNAAYVQLQAIATRIGVPDTVVESPLHTERLGAAATLGAYPFNDHFSLACAGRGLGNAVDTGPIDRLSTAPTPLEVATAVHLGDTAALSLGAVDVASTADGTRLSGWALVDGQPADCVLLVVDGTVVGGGVTGLNRGDLAPRFGLDLPIGWTAVAPVGTDPDDVTVLVGRAGEAHLLPLREGD